VTWSPAHSLFVTGLSYRTAPIEVREQLAVNERDLGDALRWLHTNGALREVLLLSTCNRLELWGAAGDAARAAETAFAMLCRDRGVDPLLFGHAVYTRVGPDAIKHGFRVAASLDSLVLGEPQILGQVKAAYAAAVASGTVGALLHRFMTQAFSAAKRVRTETELGRHAVSVSSAAVELANKIFGDLADRTALLIGAGTMGELAARHLADAGIATLYVANRTWSRAVELAAALDAVALPFERCVDALADIDIVVTSAAAPEPIIRAADVRRVLGRRTRPLFFIDIAIPRNVAADVAELGNVYCYDVDDLGQVVEANARERTREAERAETLLDREAASFAASLSTLQAVPTIVSLREKLEGIRREELERVFARPGANAPEVREALEAMSARIVNKILHGPLACLHAGSRDGRAVELIASVRELFALDQREATATPPERSAPPARVEGRFPIRWTGEPAT
jgi:glutamyl-tRNA reductase